jgi:hypothetical protein
MSSTSYHILQRLDDHELLVVQAVHDAAQLGVHVYHRLAQLLGLHNPLLDEIHRWLHGLLVLWQMNDSVHASGHNGKRVQ